MLSTGHLRAIPKVITHHHLDGSIRFETILDIWKKNKLDLGVRDADELYKKVKITSPMKDLQTVLDTFWTMQKVLCHYDAIKRIAFENVEDCYRDGVVAGELRFAPEFIATGKKMHHDEVIEAILDGVLEGMKKYPVQLGLISILPRSLDFERNKQANKAIIKYKKSSHPGADLLVGFDLADDEERTDPNQWAPLAKEAYDSGLHITIHSGEGTAAHFVKQAVEVYKAERIGHGISSIQDPEVLKYLKDRHIHLELCPTSNWLTNCVKKVEEHPLPQFYRHGISFSINTDDPHLMNIDLINEYNLCQTHWGFGLKDFRKINIDTLDHLFIDPDRIDNVKTRYFS